MSKKLTKEEFISKANIKHNRVYDYSLVEYKDSYSKIKIVCPFHGVFEQEANSHLRGSGCKICRNNNLSEKRRLDIEVFISKSSDIHNNFYDYSAVNYINSKDKIKIICPIHGEFEQIPANHLKGHGCKKCADLKTGEKLSHGEILFIENANNTHNNKYNYSLIEYKNNRTKIKIICDKHGVFEQYPGNHLHKKQGCPLCIDYGFSKVERDVSDFIKEYVDVSLNTKINNCEFDILCVNKNIAIEFNGLYWHCDKFKDKNYHLNKTVVANKNNLHLIHIFEDEWFNKRKIVESRIKNILGFSNKIYARKCEIRKVSSKDSSSFLEENHIQGNVNSKIKLGLYHNNELVSLMTFGSLRKNLGQEHKDGVFELLRFCNKLNTSIVGGASKLLKYFERNYKPKEIISYADRRWSKGNLYEQLKFDFVHNSRPNYFYFKKLIRENRFKYRKSELVKQGFDPNKTEKQIMEERGYNRIYDCGTMKFIKKYEKS